MSHNTMPSKYGNCMHLLKTKNKLKKVLFANKVGKNAPYFVGVFNKTIIPLMLVVYEMIIATSALCASLAIYHLISGGERGETAVFAGYWCTQLTFFLFLGVWVKNLTIWHCSKHDFHWKDEKKIFQHSTWKKVTNYFSCDLLDLHFDLSSGTNLTSPNLPSLSSLAPSFSLSGNQK